MLLPRALRAVGGKPSSRKVLIGTSTIASASLLNAFSMMAASMEKAFKSDAEAIVLVPIKTFLDDGFPPTALKARGKSMAKVYCVTLGQPDLAPQLTKIANDTKGAYRDVPLADVRAAVGQ